MYYYSGNLHHLRCSNTTLNFPYKFPADWKVVIAYEDKEKVLGKQVEPHLHFVLAAPLKEDQVRTIVKNIFGIENGKRGKKGPYACPPVEELTPALEYACKYGDIRQIQGFTPAEIEQAVLNGASKHLKKNSPAKVEATVEVPKVETPAPPRDNPGKNPYQKMLEYYLDDPEVGHYTTMREWRQLVKSWYLSRGHAIPCQSDIMRFAYSAWCHYHVDLSQEKMLATVARADIQFHKEFADNSPSI